MRKQKKRILISSVLALSLLMSPFSNYTIPASAAESTTDNTETKTITGITVSLKKAPENNIFNIADSDTASDEALDLEDIIVTASFSEGDPETISLPSSKYNITTNVADIRKKEGKNQKVTATLTIKNTDNTETKLESSNELLVTVLPAKTVTPKNIRLKLKDEKQTTFYAASDILGKNETLDEDDFELDITYEIKTPKDNYFDISNENERYSTEDKTKKIDLPTDKYDVTTNISEVRSKVGKNQEVTAKLKYKVSEDKTTGTETYKTIDSTNNPKVNIIEPEVTSTLSSIKLKLKDNKDKFNVDNGLMSKNDTLDLDDLVLVGTFEKNIKTGSSQYKSDKTEEKELSFDSKDYKVTTNVDSVRKVVFYNKKSTPQAQEITAKLTYKGADGKDVSLTASTKATIIAPKAVNGVVTIEPQNVYYGSTGSNKNGVDATDIKNDKFDIQCALDMASADHKLVVHFPTGNYYLSNSLYIHSNTTLQFDNNAVLVRNSNSDVGVASGTTDRLGVNHNILKIAPYNSTTTDSVGGYTNGENIRIEGGTFDGGFVSAATQASNLLNLGHARNLLIKNCTFKNCYGNHLIELCGIDTAEITNCTFTGFRHVTSEIKDEDGETEAYNDPNGDLAEAIQIDVAHKDSKSKWTSAYKTDDTACNNITIHDNTFTDYPVAIGNHHALDGHHHTNIKIINNKIIGNATQNSGIKLFGCDNSVISSNTITNYSTGIKSSESKAFSVEYNNISSATYGVISTDASSGQIVSNTIDKLNNQGIILYGSGTTATVISLNTISNSKKSGILVHSTASCETVSSNNINTCTESAIKVYSSGSVNSLKTNVINNCQSSGIEICSSANVPSVAENTISNVNGCGINVYGSANVPSITKNKITQAGASGIEINSNAVATNIKNNTIDKCSQYGIFVTGKASVKTLSSNTIKNIAKNGIYVKNDKIKLTFKSNKLTRVGKTAIKIDSKLSAKKTQKYTFAPKVISLNLKGGVMTTQASNLKKIKLKVGSKPYTKSTKKKKYTFKFKKYKKKVSSATVTFTDKNKNTVARVLDFN